MTSAPPAASFQATGQIMQLAAPIGQPQFVAPGQAPVDVQLGPPQKLTEGFPDPASVEKQKAAYAKGLEQQLKANSEVVNKRSEAEKEALMKQAAASKAAFNLQIETQLQAQARALDEQTNAQMLALQEAAAQQKSTLEGQAAGIKLEWEQKKAQEEMMIRQYDIQKQYYEAQMKLQQQAGQYQDRGQVPPPMSQSGMSMVPAPVPGMMPVPPGQAVAPMVPSYSMAPGTFPSQAVLAPQGVPVQAFGSQTVVQGVPPQFLPPTASGQVVPYPAGSVAGSVPTSSYGKHYSIPALEPGGQAPVGYSTQPAAANA